MTLAELKPGQSFTVTRLTLARETGKRLADMGCIRGAQGRLVRVAHFGDPIEIEIRGCHVSLRLKEARGVVVR